MCINGGITGLNNKGVVDLPYFKAMPTKIRGFEPVTIEGYSKLKNKDANKPNIYITSNVIMPQRGTKISAGYDFANPCWDITIEPHETVTIWTNVKAYMQQGEFLMLDVRSSIGIKKGLRLANTIGIIDADYYNNESNEGNIGIALYNPTDNPVVIEEGERIAQGIFVPFLVADNCNSEKERVGGIGSTNAA